MKINHENYSHNMQYDFVAWPKENESSRSYSGCTL